MPSSDRKTANLRRMAREAKAEAASRRQQWEKADIQARLLIEELDPLGSAEGRCT